MANRWEYKVVNLVDEIKKAYAEPKHAGQWINASDFERVLNTLGLDNWELVNVQFIHERGETVVICFFKRPLI